MDPITAIRQNKIVDRFDGLIGSSYVMQNLYKQILKAAATDVLILLIGESGTGKELAAAAIHRFSKRCKGPYIPINLSALPTTLMASVLFGHEKGAFTGAIAEEKGVFEKGKDGTVFLDEIGSIDTNTQVSLLRMFENQKFRMLGGKREIENNARIIAATNANLEKMIREKSFRRDLYYRLDVFRISMPPLRDKKGDIPALVEHFLKEFNAKFNKDIEKISSECHHIFLEYDWPGNVRELRNVIQRAVVECEDKLITSDNLPSRFRSTHTKKSGIRFQVGTPLKKIEREMIVQTLGAVNNNRTEAAELLGLSRRGFYNKLNKHNLK
ncbi:AAA domain-containing protein [candidate division KSB1 bacterium]|nr:AAA domain-containing protein [candidate division KSB1 bacterium]